MTSVLRIEHGVLSMYVLYTSLEGIDGIGVWGTSC